MQDISSICLMCLNRHSASRIVYRFGHDEQESFKNVFPELELPEPGIPAFICCACLKTLNYTAKYKTKSTQNYLCWMNSVNKSEKMSNTQENNTEENIFQILTIKSVTVDEYEATTSVPLLENENPQAQIISNEQSIPSTTNKLVHRYNTRRNSKMLQSITNSKAATVTNLDQYFSKNANWNINSTSQKTTNAQPVNGFIPNYKQTLVAQSATNIQANIFEPGPSSSSNLRESKKRGNTNTNGTSKKVKTSLRKIYPNILLKCPYCDNEVLADSVGHHLSTHLSTYGEYECQICKEKCSHDTNLTKHMHIHSQYKCTICNEMFTDESSFTEHMKTHKCVFICEICNNEFSRKKRLMLNKQTGKYRCEFCAFDLICQFRSNCIHEWGEPNGPEYINIY